MGEDGLWDQLPKVRQRKCRELMSRLLLGVVVAEARGEEEEGERETQAGSS
jgi:hypothetical protein